MSRQYITTAIDYPNAAPHMGHVLEKILADVCARWMRLRGDEVRFQIGADEHGVKIQQTAKVAGITPEELVDTNVPIFEELYRRADVSADAYIRTSDRATVWPDNPTMQHRPTVEILWKKLREAGMLEQRTYEGLYCSGCERFITEKDLVEGKCPDHNKVPERVSETNWFFALSKETAWLKKILTDGTYTIVPPFRAPETLQLIERGLEDVSFSRPKKTLSWGIPVPDDADQTMYVWCDALTNYISGIDYFGANEDMARHAKRSPEVVEAPLRPSGSAGHTSLREVWWDDATVTHVIGKDIARFHALIWPAMLKNAGAKIPDRLLIHGFITSEGQKMSKSLGNVVAPAEPIEKIKQGALQNPRNATLNLADTDAERMGVDALRFFLSHQIPVGNDGDFSWERYVDIYNGVLGGQIGNLLNRVIILLKKEGGTVVQPDAAVPELREQIAHDWGAYPAFMDALQVDKAVACITGAAEISNRMMQTYEPWKKTGAEKTATLASFAEALRHIALMLLPITPRTAQEISLQLGVPYADRMLDKSFVISEDFKKWAGCPDWTAIGEPKILFAAVA